MSESEEEKTAAEKPAAKKAPAATKKPAATATKTTASDDVKVTYLHDLRPAPGSNKAKTRVGRGEGSKGKTSGRGTKGTKARYQVPLGFEGGQMPLFRTLPKRGFHNPFSKQYATINVADLNAFENDAVITAEVLVEAGFIHASELVDGLKILGDGDLEKKLTVQATKFTKSAEEKIQAAGGKAEVI